MTGPEDLGYFNGKSPQENYMQLHKLCVFLLELHGGSVRMPDSWIRGEGWVGKGIEISGTDYSAFFEHDTWIVRLKDFMEGEREV